MLLTCNECNTQYRLPSGLITEEGRKVKCKNCSHIWFQEFIPEEENIDDINTADETNISADTQEEQNDKKNSDKTKKPLADDKPGKKKKAPKKIINKNIKPTNTNIPKEISKALKLTLVIFLLITSVSVSVYGEFFPGLFGQEKIDNIIFNNLTMEKKRGDTGWDIDIKLSLENITDDYQKIPPININVMSKGNRVMNHFVLNAEVNEIPPKEIITTERILENIAGSAEKITFDIGNSWELSFRN